MPIGSISSKNIVADESARAPAVLVLVFMTVSGVVLVSKGLRYPSATPTVEGII